MEQGTKEWHDFKLGKISASNIEKLMVGVLGRGDDYLKVVNSDEDVSFSKGALTYLDKLVGEKTGIVSSGGVQTESMLFGTAMEPKSRALYEEKNNCKVVEYGFIEWNGYNVGVSPDGMDLEALTYQEIKNYNTKKVEKIVEENKPPKAAYLQIMMGLLTTGYERGVLILTDFRPMVKYEYTEMWFDRDEELLEVMYKRIIKASEYIDAQVKLKEEENIGWLFE